MKFFTPKQLAERWAGAVCIGTLANWRTAGKGPAFEKVGGRVVYTDAAVDLYEAENKMDLYKQLRAA